MVATALVVRDDAHVRAGVPNRGRPDFNQKGLAENDQNVRTMTTLLRGDISQRTFRDVVPFQPGDDTRNDITPSCFQFRRGFFSISENDPDNPADDVLHLTIADGSRDDALAVLRQSDIAETASERQPARPPGYRDRHRPRAAPIISTAPVRNWPTSTSRNLMMGNLRSTARAVRGLRKSAGFCGTGRSIAESF